MAKTDIVTRDRDKRGRAITLSPEQRRQRAREAGLAAHSISAYVKRIVRDAPQLSAADLAALRSIIAPTAYADVYADGLRDGAKLAAERLQAVAAELAAS